MMLPLVKPNKFASCTQYSWRLTGRRIWALRRRAHLVVGVVAPRPLRPRSAGGLGHYRPLGDEACAPLCAARRLAARAVPPPFTSRCRLFGSTPLSWRLAVRRAGA